MKVKELIRQSFIAFFAVVTAVGFSVCVNTVEAQAQEADGLLWEYSHQPEAALINKATYVHNNKEGDEENKDIVAVGMDVAFRGVVVAGLDAGTGEVIWETDIPNTEARFVKKMDALPGEDYGNIAAEVVVGTENYIAVTYLLDGKTGDILSGVEHLYDGVKLSFGSVVGDYDFDGFQDDILVQTGSNRIAAHGAVSSQEIDCSNGQSVELGRDSNLACSDITFTWNDHDDENVEAYVIYIGTSIRNRGQWVYSSRDIDRQYIADVNTTSFSRNDHIFSSGATVYVTLWKNISGSWQPTLYTFQN